MAFPTSEFCWVPGEKIPSHLSPIEKGGDFQWSALITVFKISKWLFWNCLNYSGSNVHFKQFGNWNVISYNLSYLSRNQQWRFYKLCKANFPIIYWFAVIEISMRILKVRQPNEVGINFRVYFNWYLLLKLWKDYGKELPIWITFLTETIWEMYIAYKLKKSRTYITFQILFVQILFYKDVSIKYLRKSVVNYKSVYRYLHNIPFEMCAWCLKQGKLVVKLDVLIWNNKGSWRLIPWET